MKNKHQQNYLFCGFILSVFSVLPPISNLISHLGSIKLWVLRKYNYLLIYMDTTATNAQQEIYIEQNLFSFRQKSQ